jgi:hypothetical protein
MNLTRLHNQMLEGCCTQVFSAVDDEVVKTPTMWSHYCPVDRTETETVDGEACCWCGQEKQ